MVRICHVRHGKPGFELIPALVSSFLNVKLQDPRKSKPLYAIPDERGGMRLIAHIEDVMIAALPNTLSSALDFLTGDPLSIAGMILTAFAGSVRMMSEDCSLPVFEESLKGECLFLPGAYVLASNASAV